MYTKVDLTLKENEEIYKEEVVAGRKGRIILKTARKFQEYLDVMNSSDGCAIRKGDITEVDLDFPSSVPDRHPLQNWFQVALASEGKCAIVDPLDCEARYKGALPGVYCKPSEIPQTLFEDNFELGTSEIHTPEEKPHATFVFKDVPIYGMVNYLLFIYDSADYQTFLRGVTNLLGGSLMRHNATISDEYGNKIMVSDNSAQPMLLMPISLIIGGYEYVYQAWTRILKKS